MITSTEAAKYDVMAGARLNLIENRVLPLCRWLKDEEDVVVKFRSNDMSTSRRSLQAPLRFAL